MRTPLVAHADGVVQRIIGYTIFTAACIYSTRVYNANALLWLCWCLLQPRCLYPAGVAGLAVARHQQLALLLQMLPQLCNRPLSADFATAALCCLRTQTIIPWALLLELLMPAPRC
jgi:hypothetical protein